MTVHVAGDSRGARWLIYLAALCSGTSTLVYELVWMRTLSLSVGATWPAISVVLAGFMLGLGVGAVIGGRLTDRSANPLKVYVQVELAVIVVAALFPLLAGLLSTISLPGLGLIPGRALLSAVALLPATTLMGLTFPLLSTALHRHESAAHVPVLYGVNTLGAALGCLVGGLVLPYMVGAPKTLVLAAVLNLGAAGFAALGTRFLRRSTRARTASPVTAATPPTTSPAGAAGALAFTRGRVFLLMALAFGSGMLIMANELLWTRSMLQLNNRTYLVLLTGPQEVVTLVLVLVLLGNALGSLWSAALGRRPITSHLRALVWTYGLGSLTSLLCLEWFALQWLKLHLYPMPQWPSYAGWARLIPVIPPSILLGATFPLLAKLFSGALEGHGKRMGRVWLYNTFGAVLGSLVCGGILIPSLGTGAGLVLSAGLGIGLAAICLVLAGRHLFEALFLVAALAAVAGTAMWVPLGPGQWFNLRYGPDSVVASWEGWQSTTIVADTPEGRTMATNGWTIIPHQGYVHRAQSIRARMPEARQVLLVGFGSGKFAEQFLQMGSLVQLTVVEIEPGQFQAARHFGTAWVFDDPKLRWVADDAMHYISHTPDRYDMIVIDSWGPEASPPIYTREFHERALSRLTDSGAIYVKLSPLTEPSLRPVFDAVRCVYPHAYTGVPPDMAYTLVGTRDPENGRGMVELPAKDAAPCFPLEHLHPQRLTVDLKVAPLDRPIMPAY